MMRAFLATIVLVVPLLSLVALPRRVDADLATSTPPAGPGARPDHATAMHAVEPLVARARSPLGPRCDAALAEVQAEYNDGLDFKVRTRLVRGVFRWSDMCGVWGTYVVELAPDDRPAHPWRWNRRRRDDPEAEAYAEMGEYAYVAGSRRANGWRATFVLRGDHDPPGHDFVETFKPAVDICLASAAAAPPRH